MLQDKNSLSDKEKEQVIALIKEGKSIPKNIKMPKLDEIKGKINEVKHIRG